MRMVIQTNCDSALFAMRNKHYAPSPHSPVDGRAENAASFTISLTQSPAALSNLFVRLTLCLPFKEHSVLRGNRPSQT